MPLCFFKRNLLFLHQGGETLTDFNFQAPFCQGGRKKKMRLRAWRLTFFFCAVWAATLLYGEMFAFWTPSIWSCSWPHPAETSGEADFVKVAVITDPQLTDGTSLSLAPKSLALETVQFYSDMYMRRAFIGSILPFKPDVILFLGDYFDGGHILSDDLWKVSLSRFKQIFDLNKRERISGMEVYYIPGNHDIGYAAHIVHEPEVVKRYEKEFGTRNYKITLGKVDFIAVDAQTIDGRAEGVQASQTWDFMKKVPAESNPRVLLTHIPLYRPDGTPCGPHRSSAIINQRVSIAGLNNEIVYQNYVTKESSDKILDLIKPVLVLSGHDHDQCSVTHMTKNGPVKEHTVGTVSWQQGNLFPSFMLLSASKLSTANGSVPENAVATQLCFLPNQLLIYMWYILLCVVTILVPLLWPSQGVDLGFYLDAFLGAAKKFVSSTKEKSDDEDCEYEMVWDAEGSMHLVKKASKRPSIDLKEAEVGERGGAVMRPNRRQTNQEQDVGVSIDVEGDQTSSRTLVPRPGNWRMKVAVRRVLRVAGMVSAIALVNVPLYMMLLFKDWADQ